MRSFRRFAITPPCLPPNTYIHTVAVAERTSGATKRQEAEEEGRESKNAQCKLGGRRRTLATEASFPRNWCRSRKKVQHTVRAPLLSVSLPLPTQPPPPPPPTTHNSSPPPSNCPSQITRANHCPAGSKGPMGSTPYCGVVLLRLSVESEKS